MRAAAIVMPLPRRVNGASLFGKTLETVLAERPCRVIIESQPGSAPAAEDVGVIRGYVLPAADGPDRDRADRADADRRAGCELGRADPRRAVHRRRRRPDLRGAQAVSGPLKRQLGSPGAVRDRPGLHRGVDLLLDRAGRRARAGADVGGVRRRRRAVRGRRAVLRRGRVAAPGARRRDRDRPLRVQRAGQLHRRLGDLPRLPDPRRAVRVRVHRLPRGLLGRLQRGLQRVPDRRRDRALRRVHGDPRAGSAAVRARRRAGPRRSRASSCWCWSSGSRCCSSPRC